MNNISNQNDEKIRFICSLKNCKKGRFYKIILINDQKTLGDFLCLETEELENKDEKGLLNFKDLKNITYNFNKRQLINIQIIRKEFTGNKFNYISNQLLTCLASMINSPSSIYERNINNYENNPEILIIKLEEDNIISNSEIFGNSFNIPSFNIFKFFKNGSKLKFHFLFDFSDSNEDDNEFLKSINLFNNLFVYCYNNYHLYTLEKDIYMYGTGAKRFKEEKEIDYFNINSEDETNMVKTCGNMVKCFINCLNDIIREKNIFIISFLRNIINNCNKEKKFYNVVFLCLRNLSDENEIKELENLIKSNEELKIPLKIILIHIKDKNNINKIKNNIFSESSLLICIEIESKFDLDNQIQHCFQQIGKDISKFQGVKDKINIININNQKKEIHDKRVLRSSVISNENTQNPFAKKLNPINESENESESTDNKNIINKEISNPYSAHNQKKNAKCFNSNEKTASDSMEYQIQYSFSKNSDNNIP